MSRYNPKPNANAEAVYFLRDAPPAARKQFPIATGVMDYFPDALALIALVSKRGNDQHNPGQPMHWARGKSDDQADTIVRHLIDRGTLDSDGVFHSAKEAWRSVAMLQAEIEAFVREHGTEELLYVLGVMERPEGSIFPTAHVVGHIRPSDPALDVDLSH